MSLSAAMAGLAALFATAAAYYSLQATKIHIDPGWTVEPGDAHLSQMAWTAGIIKASETSGKLNRTAALIALIAALASAVSFVLDFFGS